MKTVNLLALDWFEQGWSQEEQGERHDCTHEAVLPSADFERGGENPEL